MNERGYWTLKEETDTHVFDETLAKSMQIFINTYGWNAVDIGCGNGAYVKYLRNCGIDIWGYDGSPLTPELSNCICGIMDFSKPQDIGKFDIVISIEVGEHIPKEYEQIFIDNLCRAAKRWIIMSWAVKGQGGTGHFNCQDNEYIISEMQKRRFMIDENFTNYFRAGSTFPVFQNTIMIYEKHT